MRAYGLAWFLALTTAANAAEVGVVDGQVRFAGGPNRNSVTVTFGERDVTIADRRRSVTALPGCSQASANSVSCPAGPVRLNLGGGRDIARVECSSDGGLCGSVAMFGGPGRDSLDDGERPGVLDGGPGPDSLGGWGGRDVLRGGPGNDLIRWSGAWSQVDCGAGFDEFWPHVVAHVTADCEQFRDVLGSHWPTRMRFAGGRLVLTSSYVPECPLEWRLHGPRVTSRRIGYGRVRASLPLPDDVRAPFLHARVACPDTPFPTLFRITLP